MVKLIEHDTAEFEYYVNIKICCKHCNQELADFAYVTSVGKFWRLDSMNIDWDVRYKVMANKIFCECAEILGKVAQRGIYHLSKRSVKLIH